MLKDLLDKNESSPIFRHHINYINRAHYNRDKKYEDEEPNQIVVDYIASMTDDYFVELHQHLFSGSELKIEYNA